MTSGLDEAADTQDGSAVHPDPPVLVRLSLEVAVGENPVRGRIGTAGAERDFVGWTELATAIEQCAHPAPEQEPAQ